MAHVNIHEELSFDDPVLVEGLPGVGLVGKIATDHLVETLDMDYYASCHCDGIAPVAIYRDDERAIRPPVRIYADAERDLLALQSDIPVSPQAAPGFATCLVGWFEENGVLPVCLSGLGEEKDGVPEMYAIGSGRGEETLADLDMAPPRENGMVSGPTGALLAEAGERGVGSIGLVVQANAQFPDPEAARVLLRDGIEPIADVSVDTDQLVTQAEKVAEAREQLAKQMQQADEESSQAQPLGMYQ